ncbi:hypothetical protein NCCP2716_26260 [Sporosarcina sp. NCCP-2716]|uniref:type II toxin-antitoxin system PemK/MazF family toxin n=1 Tax=Sporosarcina sp. NCCP-2716 TaxID=2943679 RepID=UPI00203DDB76|nr:type II toxin-antitoxin system PemK/MazF family toxin [Sporosarcina sp. NCCP-2716]GKV70128.1 hypothetical protein NCCP2716_26260 [Sporosarcina sp. NCCP-2716]
MVVYVPGRGDFIVISFNPQAGHEQAGRRTGIVLSPKAFNELTGFVVVCPITNQRKGYPYEVELPAEGISFGTDGTPVTGVILTDQIKSLDWRARNLKLLAQYEPAHPQIQQWDDIVEDCLAKVHTYLA